MEVTATQEAVPPIRGGVQETRERALLTARLATHRYMAVTWSLHDRHTLAWPLIAAMSSGESCQSVLPSASVVRL